MKIHSAAEAEVGRVVPTPSPTTLQAKSQALADSIRAKREGAAPGNIFTPQIAEEFRRLIAANLKHRNHRIRASIRSGELVMTAVHVNGAYPEGVPLETMPPSLLLALPKLPKELDYRFVGSALLLRDITPNVIVDVLPQAIRAR